MKKGTRVSYTWGRPFPGAPGMTGSGEVITDEVDGRVMVAVDPKKPEERHFVILCAVTWLTVIANP